MRRRGLSLYHRAIVELGAQGGLSLLDGAAAAAALPCADHQHYTECSSTSSPQDSRTVGLRLWLWLWLR